MAGRLPGRPDASPVLEELGEAECWRLLRDAVVGRLAVTVAGAPDVFPVNHVVDHGTIVFRTAVGTKLDASVGNRVAFEIDGTDEERGAAWSVVVKGIGREITHTAELLDVADAPLFPWNSAPKPRFVRIEPDSVTGRRFTVTDPAVWSTPTRGSRRTETE